MTKNSMELSFDSISQNESLARSVAAAFSTQLNPTIGELTDIRTAISEAVTNAIIHGYEGTSGDITLLCTVDERDIYIEISDRGKGIEDIKKAMTPLYTSRPELERSGLGFTVMQAFMDSLKVESVPGSGTTVRMSKKLSSDER